MIPESTRETVKARIKEDRRRKKEQDRDVLNTEECAELLGFAPYSIREFAKAGEIPGRKIGKEWRFSRRQLLEWIEGKN